MALTYDRLLTKFHPNDAMSNPAGQKTPYN